MTSDIILNTIAIAILIPVLTGIIAITKDIIHETFYKKNNDSDKT